MKRLLGIILLSLTFSGCLSDFPTMFKYVWVNPSNGNSYNLDDIQPGITEFKLTYASLDANVPIIHFNGNYVSDCFNFGPFEAVADFNCFSQYALQGKNTIQVAHENFGPDVHFNVDTKGPNIAIREVCYSTTSDCSITAPSAGSVIVKVEYIDPSDTSLTRLNGNDPYISVSNKVKYFYVPESNTYNFNTRDTNNYLSTHTYKASGQKINEVIDARIDETMLFELKDKLAEGMSNMIASPAVLAGLQGLDGPIGTKISINYLETGSGSIRDIYITDEYGYDANLGVVMRFEPFNTYVHNNGNINDFNDVGMRVDVNVKLPWWLLGLNLPMSMWVERVVVNSAVDLSIDSNSKVQLTLRQLDSGADVLKMFDVSSNESNGVDLIGWLVEQPFLRGIILTVVQDVINRNLEEIVVGMSVFPTDHDPDTEIGILFEPANLNVSNFDADNIGNLNMEMKGTIETVKAHPEVRPSLGSYYVDDSSGLPSPPDTGSALSVAVNSNLINQMLLAAYNTGVTHLTLYNGEVFIGPNATDSIGSLGKIRTILDPKSPGQFFVDGTGGSSNAWLAYHGAEMQIEWHDGTNWKTLFDVDVDIEAGVRMRVVDSKLGMTLLNTPKLTINRASDIKFDNGNINFLLNGDMFIKGLVENMIYWAVPFVIDSEMIIDISKAGLSENITTETMDNSNGHLTFEMGVSP